MGDTGYNNVGENEFMNLQTIGKILVAALMISVIAGAVTAQSDAPEVETQQEPEEGQEVLENETDQPEQASQNVRLPGDRFYGFTQLSERAELAVSRAPIFGSDDREARTLANHAEKRLAESEGLSERGDTERASQALERYSESISAANRKAESSGNEETRQRMAEASQNHEERLNRVAERLPEEAQQGIQTALENSREARRGGPSGDRGPQEDDRGASQAPGNSNASTERQGNESGQQQGEAGDEQAGQESGEQAENGEETPQQEQEGDTQSENESGEQQESEEDEDSTTGGYQSSR